MIRGVSRALFPGAVLWAERASAQITASGGTFDRGNAVGMGTERLILFVIGAVLVGGIVLIVKARPE